MANVVLFHDALAAAGVLVAIGAVFLYLLHWTRRRRRQLEHEPTPSRAEVEDRAFNQIGLARAALGRLERDGIDVTSARRLVDSAEAARRRGDADAALGLARSAQTSLARLRESPPESRSLPDARPARGAAVAPAPKSEPAPSAGADPLAPAASVRPRLPPNKAESRFQLGLLEADLAQGPGAAAASLEVAEARRIGNDARAAYDSGDFTGALRLALRARRALGSRLETLAAPPATTAGAAARDANADAAEPSMTCRACGQPLGARDRFCRGCGTTREPATCAGCGEPLAGGDRFCGVCGARAAA